MSRNIVLGVTGGIAAYKACDLVRRLVERDCAVQVVMTAGAERFVTPLSFQAVSGRPVRTSLLDPAAEAAMGHIELARWADEILVAPATADFIARHAAGMADDLLTTLCLATAAPVTIAPAMNQQMWKHAAVQANVAALVERGVRVLGPAEGSQACGDVGPGRMLEPLDIARRLLAADPAPAAPLLRGRRVVITAGPTREPIDPVRFLTNRSSGKMGYAIAAACHAAGAQVTLVSGPVALDCPPGVERVMVETAAQMAEASHAAVRGADIFVAAAAVADYTPTQSADQKMKKHTPTMDLRLERTEDILKEVAAGPVFSVGFAAETQDVEKYARGKLASKHLDMICANHVGAGIGFDVDDNALHVIWPGGEHKLGPAPKSELASALVALIAERYEARQAA